MSDVVIRPAMPADLPDLRLAMIELQEHERRLHSTTRLPGEQIADAYLARLQQEVAEKRGAIFIAERNGVFAGFAVGWIIERDHIPESADFKPLRLPFRYLRHARLSQTADRAATTCGA